MDDLTNWLSFPLCPQSYLFLFPLLLFLCRQLKRACGRDERRDEKREEKKEKRKRKREEKRRLVFLRLLSLLSLAPRHTLATQQRPSHTTHSHTGYTLLYTHSNLVSRFSCFRFVSQVLE